MKNSECFAGRETILVVEDSPTQLEKLVLILERNGFRTVAAKNGIEALELAGGGNPDVIISDVVMPEMDGFEMCRRMKADASTRHVPVILLTALSDPRDVLRGLECGADNFITKPYDERYLVSRVRCILANLKLRSSSITRMGIEISFGGENYFITSERQQILDLLLSTYEAAVQKNIELASAQDDLRALNESLEEKVRERTAELSREVEERRLAEEKVVRLNRLYSVLSHSNQMIVRVTEKDALLADVCRGAVECGSFRMAWVGTVDADGTAIRPVAHFGDGKEFLDGMVIPVDALPACLGQAGSVGEGERHHVCNDIAGDTFLGIWKDRAMECGYNSYASFPILSEGSTSGLFSVCSSEPGFFDEKEVRLLDELTEDLSFALTSIEHEKHRRAAEEKNLQLAAIVSSSDNAIFGKTLDGVITSWNRGAEDIYGYTAGEAVGSPVRMLIPDGLGEEYEFIMGEVRRGRHVERLDTVRRRKDGADIYMSLSISPVLDASGRVVGASSIGLDVTDRKLAEEALKNEAAVTAALLETGGIISRNLDWDGVTSNVVGVVRELTACRSVMIFQLSEDGIVLPRHATGLSAEEAKRFYGLRPKYEEVACFKEAASTKASFVIGMDELADFGLDAFAGGLGLRHVILAPIIARESAVGFLCINFDSMPADTRIVKIIEGIAGQLSVAHDNSRLYLETQNKSIDLMRSLESLRVLSEIDKRILSTLDRDEIMDGALKQIRRVAPADAAGLFLIEDDSSALRFSHGWFMDLKIGDRVPLDQCSGYKTVTTGRTLVRNNLAEEAEPTGLDRAMLDRGILSDIFVPIVSKGKVHGLLHVGCCRVAGFSLDEVATVENLANQLGIALENARLLSDIEEMFINVVTAFAAAIDAKSPWTKGHSERVTGYALQIAESMGLGHEDLDRLRLAGLLHDIGKIGTYDVILDKPGRLTAEEFDLVKRHPDMGCEILTHIKQFKDILPIIRHHHERWDGSGYPAGLAGEDIPPLARILSVADSFDSMTADRPYRAAPGAGYALEEFRRCSGSQFDPVVAEAFIAILDERMAA